MSDHHKQLPLINPYDVSNIETFAERDSTTGVQTLSPSTHRKPDPTLALDAANAQDDVLALPNDALVALRKSGGLMFSSREIVVYRDGRIVRRGQGGGQKRFEDATQHLPNDQLAELTTLVQRAKFPLVVRAAHQAPDRFVYELAAKVGQAVKTAEVAPGTGPASLKRLISWLDQHLSRSTPQSTTNG